MKRIQNKKWLIVALVAVISLVAAACSDDSGGGSANADSALVQAIVDDLMTDGDAISEDRAEVECYVSRVVGSVGEDRIRALGVSETNVLGLDELPLESDEVDKVIDSLFDCIDAEAMMAESFAEDFESEEAACLADKFDEDAIRTFLRAGFTGEEATDIFEQVFGFMADCGISLGG